MNEATDEDQRRQWLKMMIIGLGACLLIYFPSNAKADAIQTQKEPQYLTVRQIRTEFPDNDRNQFRAKLLRNWWQVKYPKYVLNRSLFRTSK